MSTHDPRSSSSQSLTPDLALDSVGRRRLLLVYLHGFMGNEASFRSFPAHVHNLITITLAETHIVHTKIYPRYRSRDTLEIARDQFSTWLALHEDPWTDVILLGHSMGGLLAAEIALVFRHRIVGIVNFDVPFLGIHPGIVKAGLGSLFSPQPAPQDSIAPPWEASEKKHSTRKDTLFNPSPADPNYNPSYPNDVQLPLRKGWDNTVHWLAKHYHHGLREATKSLVRSHFEFGGAMADYPELQERYAKIRALEEEDEQKRSVVNSNIRYVRRVRFVNYYTSSTGRPKKPKSPPSSQVHKTPHSPSSPPVLPSQHHGLHLPVTEAPAVGLESPSHHPNDCDLAASSEADNANVELDSIAASPKTSSDPGNFYAAESERSSPHLEEDSAVAALGSQRSTTSRSSSDHAAHHDGSRTATPSQDRHPETLPTEGTHSATPKKLRKFCLLPPKDSRGERDPTWISVLMEDVDEVTAHTTLFFVNETYERLVGDVGARIEDWIREADSVRIVRELSGRDSS